MKLVKTISVVKDECWLGLGLSQIKGAKEGLPRKWLVQALNRCGLTYTAKEVGLWNERRPAHGRLKTDTICICRTLLWFWVWIRLTRFMTLLFMSAAVAWHETAHKIFGFADQAPVLRMPSMTHWFLFWNCNYNSIPLLAGKSAQTDGVCFCENTLHCFDNIGNIGQFLKFGNTMTDRGCSFIGIFLKTWLQQYSSQQGCFWHLEQFRQ